jgi:hypothetical protein
MMALGILVVGALILALALRALHRPPPSMDSLRAEYFRETAHWRCALCGLPRCAWSRDRCPRHARPGEWEAWREHPDYPAWRADMDAIRAEYATKPERRSR